MKRRNRTLCGLPARLYTLETGERFDQCCRLWQRLYTAGALTIQHDASWLCILYGRERYDVWWETFTPTAQSDVSH